jgi:regulator of cell morphogenesis and NO signaling
MNTYVNNTLEGNPITVAQLAISQPGALAIFTKYNIDYCCGGHRSVEDACLRLGLDPEKVKGEIYQLSGSETSQNLHPENWSSTFLVDFIIQNHHRYVRESIPQIQQFLDKVCDAHGNECIDLLNIRERFFELSEELIQHMEKEELVLFPAIKRLDTHNHDDHPLSIAIQPPIVSMEQEHVVAGDLIKQIRSLSKNYTPPDFACPTFKITYQKLQEFDNDLMRHIHLENNILFERLKRNKANNSCSL